MNIGFIGLGIMGSRMAANLLKNGHTLWVHNRSKDKAKNLLDLGAKWADSPLRASENAEVVITMLANPQAIENVALGHNGFLKAGKNKLIWVDCSTVNPSFTLAMAEKDRNFGIRFLDAPVAGTKAPAESGELIFFVGGNQADLDKVQPLLDAMGKKTIHMGEQGKGSSIKMVINLMLGHSMLAFSEAMALGQSMGLGQETLFNVLLNTPVVPPYLAGVRGKIEANDYDPNFPLRLMQKDLQLVAETAYENDVAMPSANLTKEMYAMATQQGLGDEDFSSIYRFLNPRL